MWLVCGTASAHVPLLGALLLVNPKLNPNPNPNPSPSPNPNPDPNPNPYPNPDPDPDPDPDPNPNLLGALLLGRSLWRRARTLDEWQQRASLAHVLRRRFLRDPEWRCLPLPPLRIADEVNPTPTP